MAGDHSSFHVHDPDAHLRAIEADLEYFRTKRLQPRISFLLRRGVLSLRTLLEQGGPEGARQTHAADRTVDERIEGLQDRLDAYILGIATLGPVRTGDVVIEDMRMERGDYDDFFRFSKRSHGGTTEERIGQLEREFDEQEYVLAAFTRALVGADEVTPEELEVRRKAFQQRGYRNGARLVARSWVDPDFKRRFIEQGRQVAREFDIPAGKLGKLGVAVNTEDVHNVVVCTLCSCYPADLLGDPPWWYRTDEYKQRIVEDPRAMLREMFGLELPDHMTVRVHDSTSDVRWMVLPRRPAGTDGMSEDELAELVTPESLVGTAETASPGAATER